MRIIVTGGSGFVGGYVVRRLLSDGHEVFCVCRSADRLPGGAPIIWDLAEDPPAQLPPAFDAVVHLAQARNYRRFPEHASEMFQVNVASTAKLLDVAVRAGARSFALISSGTVYEPYEADLAEDAALRPSSCLGATKFAAEIVARPYASHLALSTLRVFAPYGPGQVDRLFPDLIRRVRTREAVMIGPNGGLRFSPTYVVDLVDVIVTAVTETWTGTYNVAAPRSETIQSVAQTIGDILSVQPKFELAEGREVQLVPNLSKLASKYDLGRFLPLQDGLRQTLGCGL